MGHDIRYVPHTAIKSQALMDLVTEWTEVQLPTLDITHEYWTMYFDGSVMAPDSGAGVVLISTNGSRLRYAFRLHFLASNNTVEYEAIINGLRIAIKLGATWLYIRDDSELVINQVMKESSWKSTSWQHTARRCANLRTNSRGLSYIMSIERTMMPPIFLQNWLLGGIRLRMGSSSMTFTKHLPTSSKV